MTYLYTDELGKKDNLMQMTLTSDLCGYGVCWPINRATQVRGEMKEKRQDKGESPSFFRLIPMKIIKYSMAF